MSLSFILAAIIIIAIIIHTASYAVWNWKNGNKLGSVVVFIVCLATIVLPLYMYFFIS